MAVAGMMVMLASNAAGHQELYHNVDLDLVGAEESGEVALYFTIHAPELVVGFAEAGDAMFDKQWLSARSDAELERILASARVYLGERFEIAAEGEAGERHPVDLERRVVFDAFDAIRNAAAEKELPPACLLGTVRIEIPPGARGLRFGHAAGSDKRLLLVIIRPKSFPDVRDVEAGAAVTVALPETTVKAARRRDGVPGSGAFYTALFFGLLAMMVLLQMRRGRRLVKRKLVRKG